MSEDSVWVLLLKPTKNSQLWKANQKLWVVWTTGDDRYKVAGKYRGKGRWIEAWVSVLTTSLKYAKWVQVSRKFAESRQIGFREDEPQTFVGIAW